MLVNRVGVAGITTEGPPNELDTCAGAYWVGYGIVVSTVNPLPRAEIKTASDLLRLEDPRDTGTVAGVNAVILRLPAGTWGWESSGARSALAIGFAFGRGVGVGVGVGVGSKIGCSARIAGSFKYAVPPFSTIVEFLLAWANAPGMKTPSPQMIATTRDREAILIP